MISLFVICVAIVHFSDLCLGQEVTAKCGTIKGIQVTAPNGKPVNKFLGIPFAEPPLGPLRFRPPKPKAPFTEPFIADKQPVLCCQINPEDFMGAAKDAAKEKGVDTNAAKDEMEATMKELKITGGALALGNEFKDMAKGKVENLKGQEDCLYLNLFSPGDATPTSKKAVVIYFHGGFFYGGGIGIPSFDGTVLVSEGDIIVIAAQYRLGVYGFLHGATEEMPGNVGLRDQLESMKWVKENIEAFGGDPENVAIMGGNSGGWSTGFHLISPMSAGYFKRVIMQSGSALSPLMLFGEPAARARFEKFAKALGCEMGEKKDAKDPFALPIDKTYECMASKTREEVDKAQAAVLTSKKDSGFLPSEDNTKDICFFCMNPFDFVKDGNFKGTGEVLMGTNSNEGGMFLASGLRDIYPPFKGDPKPYDLNALVDHAKKFGAGANAGQMQMMLPMFFRGVDKKDPVAVRNRLLELISDGMFVCPDQLLLNAYVKKGTVWYYRFDYRPSKSYWNTWLQGSLHMDDHQFVWGVPFREDAKVNYDDKDREVSLTAMKIWSDFIKTGNPAQEKKWKWKPCKGKDRNHCEITGKGVKGKKGFPKNSCKDLTRYYSMGRSFLKNYKPS